MLRNAAGAIEFSPLQSNHTGYRGLFARRRSGWGTKSTTHLHEVTRLRMCEAKLPLRYTPSWRAQDRPYFFTLFMTSSTFFTSDN